MFSYSFFTFWFIRIIRASSSDEFTIKCAGVARPRRCDFGCTFCSIEYSSSACSAFLPVIWLLFLPLNSMLIPPILASACSSAVLLSYTTSSVLVSAFTRPLRDVTLPLRWVFATLLQRRRLSFLTPLMQTKIFRFFTAGCAGLTSSKGSGEPCGVSRSER